jgi:hypothetical protein
VVVVITKGVLFTAHVGDCRAVLINDAAVVGTNLVDAATSAPTRVGPIQCIDQDTENHNHTNSNNSSSSRKKQPLSDSQPDSRGSSVSSLCRLPPAGPPSSSVFTLVDTFLLDVERKTAPSSSSSSQSSQHSSQSLRTYSKRPTRTKAPPSKKASGALHFVT